MGQCGFNTRDIRSSGFVCRVYSLQYLWVDAMEEKRSVNDNNKNKRQELEIFLKHRTQKLQTFLDNGDFSEHEREQLLKESYRLTRIRRMKFEDGVKA
jgi:hypothetical protein